MQSRFSQPRTRFVLDRFALLFFIAAFFFLAICSRLAWLQLVNGDEYLKLAEEQNSRGVVLPAKRGTIYARDTRTAELYPLAQNSTTYTIFADPLLVENELQVAEMLAPLLWVDDPLADADAPTTPITEPVEVEPETDRTKVNDESAPAAAPTTPDPDQPPAQVTERTVPTQVATPEPAVSAQPTNQTEFKNWVSEKLRTKDVLRRVLGQATAEEQALVRDAHLPGVEVSGEQVVVNPLLIDDPDKVATQLALILDAKYSDIHPLLQRKKVRFVKLGSQIVAPVKDQIIALGLRGIGAIPEYRRVYPEGQLASQIVGFINHEGVGTYGIEGQYQKDLAGKAGLRRTQVDPHNRQITVGEITMTEAVDGASLVLTIDRAVQAVLEKELTKAVEDQRADSGQAIIMDPKTGAILALAHTPSFDPNNFGAVYEREILVKKERRKTWTDPNTLEPKEEIEEYWETAKGEKVVTEFDTDYIIRGGYRYPIFTEGAERVIYANRYGGGVLGLKALTEPYEPGSVFKSIVMAMALDAGEVTPGTRSPYSTPVQLDETIRGKPIIIKNALGHYFGRETMTEVIEHSSNIGMTFVAQRLGRATFYDYLKKFGFAERTDIELPGENAGQLANYTRWTDSEMITKAFGQGITVNLVQLATAYSALANGGLLMKPYIVAEELYPDGRRVVTEPTTVRRVISPETSQQITGILISSVRRGFAKSGAVEGYLVAGKTGTTQTYGRDGRALFGVGSTIAGFGGYAPATDPKFVMIVRVDRPRVSEWGEGSAGVVFRAVASELLKNYFAILPQ